MMTTSSTCHSCFLMCTTYRVIKIEIVEVEPLSVDVINVIKSLFKELKHCSILVPDTKDLPKVPSLSSRRVLFLIHSCLALVSKPQKIGMMNFIEIALFLSNFTAPFEEVLSNLKGNRDAVFSSSLNLVCKFFNFRLAANSAARSQQWTSDQKTG
jgi:hypothetical protein